MSHDLLTFWETNDNISSVVQDRDRGSGRLIGNHMRPIEWHHCHCPWMTLKIAFAVEIFLTSISRET